MRKDKRQSSYCAGIKVLEKVNKEYKFSSNIKSTEPFFASNVNLGILQDNIRGLLKRGVIDNTDDIIDFIGKCVQRVKHNNVEVREKGTDNMYYSIAFTTKDDFGWYNYKFSVHKR